jgi:hypothetical protein
MQFTEFSSPVGHNKTLNPKIWDLNKNRLESAVKGALIRIAADFEEFVEVPLDVIDLRITGGNANYNYTEHSDIDLHLIADFSKVQCDRTVAELMDTKRLLYKRTYKLDVMGIPVELYVEDKDHPAVSAGCYSILHDEWIKEPNPNIPEYDKKELAHWVSVWETIIKNALDSKSLHVARTSIKLLRDYRKLGLKTKMGEFSIPNLVYKSLRNDKLLEKLQSFIDQAHDQELSLK